MRPSGAREAQSPVDILPPAQDATYREGMRAIPPSPDDLQTLSDHRDDASVSIYLESSPLPSEHQRVKLALKNAVTDAVRQLDGTDIGAGRVGELRERLEQLADDREFWQHQSRGIALFASPDSLRSFRVFSRLTGLTAVGDRFDIGPLLRSVSFENGGYVLALTEGSIRLIEVSAEARPVDVELTGLPDDLHTVLEYASNEGQADRQRARGATGESIERQRYCRIVQGAVLAAIGDSELPLILAASRELEPAYREINDHDGLLSRGIDVHPGSLDVDDLESRARAILDEHYAEKLTVWREQFGTHRSNGRATSRIAEVAHAATVGAVEELLFDMDDTREGSIDEDGIVHAAEEAGPTTYGLIDEIAVRVLRNGGTVRAVRNRDLLDGSPVAAVLRYPLAG